MTKKDQRWVWLSKNYLHLINNFKDEKDDSSTNSDQEPTAEISFGALAKAQASFQKDRTSGKLKKPGEKKLPDGPKDDTWENNEALERKAGRKDHRGFSRSNKHAPTEISSKKAVSRRREVIAVPKKEFRDPRFEPLSGDLDESKIQKVYSFLDDYRDDEIKELKAAVKKTKDDSEKEKLKRALLSMESKKKAQMRRRKEQDVLDKHKKEEKELVKQGKQPFFLKKAEQSKRVLVEQYGGLKGKELDHVLERRRKKQDAKEKKKMPWARREGEKRNY